jgi:hypothetical protein
MRFSAIVTNSDPEAFTASVIWDIFPNFPVPEIIWMYKFCLLFVSYSLNIVLMVETNSGFLAISPDTAHHTNQHPAIADIF